MSLAFDAGLLVLLLGLGWWIVAAPSDFAATVGFVVYGLLLAVAWLRLGAPDVALTEAAVGGGVTGAILLRAATRLSRTAADSQARPPPASLRLAVGMLCLAVTVGLAVVVVTLPSPAPTLAPTAAAHLAEVGLGNPVTAVLLAYRALDTFLEKVVLVVAILGIWSLAPDRFWRGRPGRPYLGRTDGPLPFLGRVLPPVGILIGVHLLWLGADHPGGAFQAGAVLAAMWLLAAMAGLVEPPATGGRGLRVTLVVGALLFLVVGLAGSVTAGAFFAYPTAWAKPLILAIEAAMTVSIATTLVLMVAGPPGRRAP
jgi:multisubunit Na+/H+ antiporter MnhB subunit